MVEKGLGREDKDSRWTATEVLRLMVSLGDPIWINLVCGCYRGSTRSGDVLSAFRNAIDLVGGTRFELVTPAV